MSPSPAGGPAATAALTDLFRFQAALSQALSRWQSQWSQLPPSPAISLQEAGLAVSFSRSGLSGTLEVSGTTFRMQAQLGFLLSAFKDRIEAEIQKNLDELIASHAKA